PHSASVPHSLRSVIEAQRAAPGSHWPEHASPHSARPSPAPDSAPELPRVSSPQAPLIQVPEMHSAPLAHGAPSTAGVRDPGGAGGAGGGAAASTARAPPPGSLGNTTPSAKSRF